MQLTIPKVDYKIISNQVDASFNAELEKFNYAISHYGFLLLQNTPIDKKVKNNILKTYKAFFDLPFEEKNKVNMDLTSSNRGWGAPKGEQVNPDYNPDYKEIFDTGPHQKVKDEFRDLTYYAKNFGLNNYHCLKILLIIIMIFVLKLG